MSEAGVCRRALQVAGLLSAIWAIGPVGSAQAAVTHVFQASFPVTGSPRGVAVDEETSSVYVVATGPSSLQKFDAAGVPSNFSGTGSNTIPLTETPRNVAVDNSGGTNKGVIYVGTETSFAFVYTRAGLLAAEFDRASSSDRYTNTNPGPFCGVAVDSVGNWLIAHPFGFIQEPYVDKFHPGLWIGNASPQQDWPISGTMEGIPQGTCRLAIDAENSIYTGTGSATETGQIRKFPSSVFSLEKPPSKVIDNSSTAFAVDTSSNDLYSDRNSSLVRFDKDGVLRESFATAEFEQSAGIAVNSKNSTVYASVREAGGVEKTEARIYKGVITPDITGVGADAGQITATVSATIGTAGAGNVTGCDVEYGTTTAYGSSATCTPDAAGTPYSGNQAVVADIPGLAKETTYHYRFTATNVNGTNRDIDRTFTTHNVRGLQTDEPTSVTQTGATLNGSFVGDGDPTTYEFEWGTTTSYGNTIPGGTESAAGPVAVSAPVTGLLTYLPTGQGIYHYRIVASNSSGTTLGPDREFHTAPPALPQIEGIEVSEVSTGAALVSASINPGGGDTVFSIDYGQTGAYGSSSLVSGSIGSDETSHPVSMGLSGLAPGTSYHYRVVAVNFGGTSYGPDLTFTTVGLPEPPPPPLPQPVAPKPAPRAETPKPAPKKCKRGFVRRKGKCVRRHRKRHRSHNRGRGANQ